MVEVISFLVVCVVLLGLFGLILLWVTIGRNEYLSQQEINEILNSKEN
jgi:hypothetical protein